jgi:hypothetical protein
MSTLNTLLLPDGYTLVTTDDEIGELGRRHLTGWGAGRAAARANDRRIGHSVSFRPVRRGRWSWAVVAFQNLAVPPA